LNNGAEHDMIHVAGNDPKQLPCLIDDRITRTSPARSSDVIRDGNRLDLSGV